MHNVLIDILALLVSMLLASSVVRCQQTVRQIPDLMHVVDSLRAMHSAQAEPIAPVIVLYSLDSFISTNGIIYRDAFTHVAASRDEHRRWKVVAIIREKARDRESGVERVLTGKEIPSIFAGDPRPLTIDELLQGIEEGGLPRVTDRAIEDTLRRRRILKPSDTVERLHAILDTADLNFISIVHVTGQYARRITEGYDREENAFVAEMADIETRMHHHLPGLVKTIRNSAQPGCVSFAPVHDTLHAADSADTYDRLLTDSMVMVALRWSRVRAHRPSDHYLLMASVDGEMRLVGVLGTLAGDWDPFFLRLWIDADAEAYLHRFGLDTTARRIVDAMHNLPNQIFEGELDLEPQPEFAVRWILMACLLRHPAPAPRDADGVDDGRHH